MTICLNMIVKNESHIITRCLESVAHLIDYWVISDTGSTDGTQDIIRQFFTEKGIPGELVEHSWQNFATNRNLALEAARDKADYILFMDADDYLKTGKDFNLKYLSADCYCLNIEYGNLLYDLPKIIKTSKPWHWVSVLHEYLECHENFTEEVLKGDYLLIASTSGARGQNPRKYLDDAEVLENALLTEPNNSRYRFYLAQSYRDARIADKALENYLLRVEMGGWNQEVFCAMLEAAKLKEALDYPHAEIVDSYLKAYEYRPQRAESLYHLARYCRLKDMSHQAYMYASTAAKLPLSDDSLFVDKYIYQWCILDELAVAAYWTNHYQECANICKQLLHSKVVPEEDMDRVAANLDFAEKALA